MRVPLLILTACAWGRPVRCQYFLDANYNPNAPSTIGGMTFGAQNTGVDVWYVTVFMTLNCDPGASIPSDAQLCINPIRNWQITPGDYYQNWNGPYTKTFSSVSVQGTDVYDVLPTSPLNWNLFGDDPKGVCQPSNNICNRRMYCTLTQQYKRIPAITGFSFAKANVQDLSSFTDRCQFCMPIACPLAATQCRNGFVMRTPGLTASLFKDSSNYKYAYTSAHCNIPCRPGYWMTCLSADRMKGCTYTVPNSDVALTVIDPDASARDKQTQIALWINKNRNDNGGQLPMAMTMDRGLLIDRCFPCAQANGVPHYGSQTFITDKALFDDGYLDFYCPGGDNPPVSCPPMQVSKIDRATNASGVCKCRDGYYMDAAQACQLCPAGFFCVFGADKQPCPNDSYAPAGVSACTPCRTDTRICLDGQALRRCINGPDFQSTDAECLDCNECIVGSFTGLGLKPCQNVYMA